MEGFLIPVGMTIGSILVGSVGYMIRNILTRLTALEKLPMVTEPQVRQIIADKIDPVREDVHEIRKSVDYILNLFYNSRNH